MLLFQRIQQNGIEIQEFLNSSCMLRAVLCLKRFDINNKIMYFEGAQNSLDVLHDESSMALVYEEVGQKASFPKIHSHRLLQFEVLFLWIRFYCCNSVWFWIRGQNCPFCVCVPSFKWISRLVCFSIVVIRAISRNTEWFIFNNQYTAAQRGNCVGKRSS